MSLFDLSDYHVRQLDPAQGTKPLDFGGGGITGSINLDGRFIAINTYHPEHGYITLTSVPPFPDEDRYDPEKVRAYRKSLVSNEGFGLQFEQDIIKREYFLIEDAVPFIRFTLEDGTVAECVTVGHGSAVMQVWKFSRASVKANVSGKIWLQRAAYTQLTEGGVLPMPSVRTIISERPDNKNKNVKIENPSIKAYASTSIHEVIEEEDGLRFTRKNPLTLEDTHILEFKVGGYRSAYGNKELWFNKQMSNIKNMNFRNNNLIISRARVYGYYCSLPLYKTHSYCILTDHMILSLSWNRDSYYVASMFLEALPNVAYHDTNAHLRWLFVDTWKGTYCKSLRKPNPFAWGRAYMVNGKPKDNGAFQLDQQIFPMLEACEWLEKAEKLNMTASFISSQKKIFETGIELALRALWQSIGHSYGSLVSDETPADDDLNLPYHFSSHVLLWYTMKQVIKHFEENELVEHAAEHNSHLSPDFLEEKIQKYFVTAIDGEQVYSYASNGLKSHYLYHDANDIPLVMMPLWGFCDKNNPIWRNTIDFAFSDDNPGFYDGVLGSVHSPAPWSLGDAQELIFCKVIGDRQRYQRVWERVEKSAQWDGALPEAYDANTYEVVSRHWFAWTNAMVAIADSISWDWETEGEYAR